MADIKDRVLRVATGVGWRGFMTHIDVVTNRPKMTRNRERAIRLSAEMAETIRFNLTARGYRVRVEFV